MSDIETLALASIPSERWRNGGGITRTVAREGDEWRVSIAEVQKNGPYSRFEGQSRMSFVLRGEGVILRDAENAIELLRGQAVGYDGDIAWDAALVGGPVTALNVISHREKYRVQVTSVTRSMVVGAGRAAVVLAWVNGCRLRIGADERKLDAGSAAIFRKLNDELQITTDLESTSAADSSTLLIIVTIEPVHKQ